MSRYLHSDTRAVLDARVLGLVVHIWSTVSLTRRRPGRPERGMKTGPDLSEQIRARSVGLTGFEPATP